MASVYNGQNSVTSATDYQRKLAETSSKLENGLALIKQAELELAELNRNAINVSAERKSLISAERESLISAERESLVSARRQARMEARIKARENEQTAFNEVAVALILGFVFIIGVASNSVANLPMFSSSDSPTEQVN